MIHELLEQSYELFEAERGTKVSGLNYEEYIALLVFVDAFTDVVQNEFPAVADKIAKPGKDLMATVPEYLDSKGLDVIDFIDVPQAHRMIQRVNQLWKGKLTVADLVRFDRDAFADMVLAGLGHDLSLKTHARAKKFLDNAGVEIPKGSDLGIALDHKRYAKAYQALKGIGILKEDRQIAGHVDRAIMELEQAMAAAPKNSTRWKIQEIIYQLNAVSHG